MEPAPASDRARFAIRPGASIGPFHLGMTVAEAQEAAVTLAVPTSAFVTAPEPVALDALGLVLRFDLQGKCQEIEARIFDASQEHPIFTLRGQEVNNLSEPDAEALFRTLSRTIEFGYGTMDVPEIGLHAVKWEATDDFIFAISVRPPRRYRWR